MNFPKRSVRARMILLLSLGSTCALASPPQIIEVHKDVSISDEDRRDDMKSSGISKMNPNYSKSCFLDTTYWVISSQIFPNKIKSMQSGGKIFNISSPSENALRKMGAGSLARSSLPQEIQTLFSNHFILTSNWIENCKPSDSATLAKKFGRDNLHIGDDDICAIDDTVETIDSSLIGSKKRAEILGDEVHNAVPKLYKKRPLDFYNGGGEILVIGACINKSKADSLLIKYGQSVLGVRILSN